MRLRPVSSLEGGAELMETLYQIGEYLSYPFVRYALIAAVLVALCSSLLGVTLVLRRFSLLGDGLSHAAFGALAVATVLHIATPLPFVLAFTAIAAVALLMRGARARVRGDAATAVVSVGALALGYMLMNVFGTTSNVSGDVCSTLFGSTSIMTLSPFEVWLCAGLSVAVIALYACFHDRVFAITFDEDFARASGLSAGACNFVLAVVVAAVVVLAMNLVGALLVSALVVFPALTAMRVFGGYRAVVLASAAVAVAGAVSGLLSAIAFDTPVGPTIVSANLFVYVVVCALQFGMRRLRR